MRAYITRCRLRNGVCLVLTIIATSSCSAIVIAQDTFGDQLAVCSARPA